MVENHGPVDATHAYNNTYPYNSVVLIEKQNHGASFELNELKSVPECLQTTFYYM